MKPIYCFLLCLTAAVISGSAWAFCPEKPVTLCDIVKKSDIVIHGKVNARQLVVDEDDPEGVAGWLYHISVLHDYSGGTAKQLIMYSENTTARIVLKSGKEYFVFALQTNEGLIDTSNYCSKYDEAPYTSELEEQIKECYVPKSNN